LFLYQKTFIYQGMNCIFELSSFSTFFKNNRNYKQTAEDLFVHPKTVHYRINKLADILALDFSNSVELVNYELATYFLHMKKENTFI
ncbi:helix-turn-helix domain-containing protein, partial [Tetragenococcus solitarius]|uniref:helix-turn-helix domain-containing protein n=2 Tax=Tetragenococcus solitarius TaxID=71453 RepID=UPI0031E3BFC6